jgi:hypothetical protein
LINISNIIRTEQTKHIKDKAKATTVSKVFEKALKATIALEIIAVSKKTKAITNISYYLHVRRSVIFITSQVAN